MDCDSVSPREVRGVNRGVKIILYLVCLAEVSQSAPTASRTVMSVFARLKNLNLNPCLVLVAEQPRRILNLSFIS